MIRPALVIWTLALMAALGCGGRGNGASVSTTACGSSSGVTSGGNADDAGIEGSADMPTPEEFQPVPPGMCLYFNAYDQPMVFANGDTWSCPEAELVLASGGFCQGFCKCMDGTITPTFPDGGAYLTPYGCVGSGANGVDAAFDDTEAGRDGSLAAEAASASDSGAEAGPQRDGASEAGMPKSPCTTAADCATGQLCVWYDQCEPASLSTCGAGSTWSACVDNPCEAGLSGANCTACSVTLCSGYDVCIETPDAGTVSCGMGG
jgi:hypothetical protein